MTSANIHRRLFGLSNERSTHVALKASAPAAAYSLVAGFRVCASGRFHWPHTSDSGAPCQTRAPRTRSDNRPADRRPPLPRDCGGIGEAPSANSGPSRDGLRIEHRHAVDIAIEARRLVQDHPIADPDEDHRRATGTLNTNTPVPFSAVAPQGIAAIALVAIRECGHGAPASSVSVPAWPPAAPARASCGT